ncbi:polyhydroxyalkanoate synthesis repressor PhaR [Rhodovibrionaceae bacterium A322]
MANANNNGENAPITIKKYANRRLYNTSTSSYVTLDHLCAMVKEDVDFVVYDAKSGEDITRQVLTQIIVEEESKGENLLPISFLRQLISFYGNGMQWMVPSYLEHVMDSLTNNQEQMTKAMQESMGGVFPFSNMEELGRQNMAMFEQTMKMFNPAFGGAKPTAAKPAERPAAPAASSAPAESDDQLETLKSQVDKLQAKLDSLSKDD